MPIQFDIDPRVTEAVRRTETLVRKIVLPVERQYGGNAHALPDAVRHELQDAAKKAVQSVAADLVEEDDVRALATAHAQLAGGLDLLVLNAGFGAAGSVADLPVKTYDRTLTINLRAQFLLVQQTLPLLRRAASASRGAKIVALASITGIAAEPMLAAYGASKAALFRCARPSPSKNPPTASRPRRFHRGMSTPT
ncbi:SDR family oxidoreductase [Nocardia sp. NPDC052112]|uniref:SDR family NAD(P)-dependent oxidoreductase n=1 Tax=Nocardia sp. NPDC052112 TaxID=3155646 RepID=UPI003427B061